MNATSPKDHRNWFTLVLASGQRERIQKIADIRRASSGAVVRQCVDIGLKQIEMAEKIL
jgi:hypothetical protein